MQTARDGRVRLGAMSNILPSGSEGPGERDMFGAEARKRKHTEEEEGR